MDFWQLTGTEKASVLLTDGVGGEGGVEGGGWARGVGVFWQSDHTRPLLGSLTELLARKSSEIVLPSGQILVGVPA